MESVNVQALDLSDREREALRELADRQKSTLEALVSAIVREHIEREERRRRAYERAAQTRGIFQDRPDLAEDHDRYLSGDAR